MSDLLMPVKSSEDGSDLRLDRRPLVEGLETLDFTPSLCVEVFFEGLNRCFVDI